MGFGQEARCYSLLAMEEDCQLVENTEVVPEVALGDWVGQLGLDITGDTGEREGHGAVDVG